MRMLLLAAIAMLVGACGKGEQSYREALELFCEAPTKIPDGRNKLGEAIEPVVKKITNKKAREDLSHLGEVETGKLDLLRADVKQAGLSKCTVLEIWEEQVKNPPKRPDGDPLDQPVPTR